MFLLFPNSKAAIQTENDLADIMRCFQCGYEITADNNGMAINEGEFYQCNDCHHIEFGVQISGLLLIFK